MYGYFFIFSSCFVIQFAVVYYFCMHLDFLFLSCEISALHLFFFLVCAYKIY